MATTTPQLGTKRECPKCSAKFFDMGASPIQCPKCKFSWKPEAAAKPKPVKKVEPAKPKKAVKSLLADDEDVLPESFEDTGDAVVGELEDMDELDNTPEVISLEEVEEHHEDAEVDPNSDDAEEGMFFDDLDSGGDLFDDLTADEEELEEEEESEDHDDDSEDDEEEDSPRKRRKKK